MKLLIIFSILCYLTLSSLSISSLRKRRRTRGEYTLIIQKVARIPLTQLLSEDLIKRNFVDYNGSLILSTYDKNVEEKVLNEIKIMKQGHHEIISPTTYMGYNILKADEPLTILLRANYVQYVFEIQNSNHFYAIKPELDKIRHAFDIKTYTDLQLEYMELNEDMLDNTLNIQPRLNWINKLIKHMAEVDKNGKIPTFVFE
jgi:hypothetical protein